MCTQGKRMQFKFSVQARVFSPHIDATYERVRSRRFLAALGMTQRSGLDRMNLLVTEKGKGGARKNTEQADTATGTASCIQEMD